MQFQAADIEKITGVKRNRLQQWLEHGFIAPSIQTASGHGTRNIWSRGDLYAIAVFKKVTESGLSRKIVCDFLFSGVLGCLYGDEVKHIGCMLFMRENDRMEGVAFTNAGADSITIDITEIQEELDMWSFDDVYIINFAKIKEYIDEKIINMKR